MIRWELIKIFKQKSLYFAGIFMFGWLTLVSLTNVWDNDVTRDVYREWQGPITQEKIERADKLRAELENQHSENGYDDKTSALAGVSNDITLAHTIQLQNQQLAADYTQLSKQAEQKGDQLEKNRMDLAKDMYSNVKVDKISYYAAPREAIDFVNVFGLILTGLFLIIGLSGIYSNEHATGVENYILSTKNGRQVTMKAKLIASFIFTIIVVVVWEAYNLLMKTALYGTDGWDLPIQFAYKYQASPFSLTFFEYHLIQLGLHLLAALAFAGVIVVISTLAKSSVLSFFLSGLLYGVPIVAQSIMSVDIRWVDRLLTFTLTNIMKVEALYMNFITVNISNYPILLPYVGVVVCMVTLVIAVFLSMSLIKRKQIA
ncbi:ABC transporter permease [Neobacillus dielmonensis]|uniref:ABC transporter permease n=1 Tax=Neobacillus dielmonensis TaxID=1347369 RepID=UPI0005AA3419|nr:ABC transporter permease [Neobacillus dielmonensis]